jgi:hypothetical protein
MRVPERTMLYSRALARISIPNKSRGSSGSARRSRAWDANGCRHGNRIGGFDDGAQVEWARNRDGAAVRFILERHNRELYQVARRILNDVAEAEVRGLKEIAGESRRSQDKG